nr:DinB family protein [Paenibacillus sonchi]
MNQRPQPGEYSEFPARYISLVPPEGELAAVLREQSRLMYDLLDGLSEEQGCYRYAEGKWSIKQLLGHLTDNDRIMSYRLLAIARGEKAPLPGYEENDSRRQESSSGLRSVKWCGIISWYANLQLRCWRVCPRRHGPGWGRPAVIRFLPEP